MFFFHKYFARLISEVTRAKPECRHVRRREKTPSRDATRCDATATYARTMRDSFDSLEHSNADVESADKVCVTTESARSHACTTAARVAGVNCVLELALTIVTSQITYNYEYQIIWPITCMFASFVLCAATAHAPPRVGRYARMGHLFVILSAIIGASTSRYALMSSDMYVCMRKTNNQYPTFTDVDMTTGQVSLIPGKPSCHRTKILYAFELVAFFSRLISYAFTSRAI